MIGIYDIYLVLLFNNLNIKFKRAFSVAVDYRSLNLTNPFFYQKRNFTTTKTYKLSTTKITYQKKYLDKDLKKEVVQDIKEYDQNNPRPVHVNPGYPDLEHLVNKCGDYQEYQKTVYKFKDRNTVQLALQEHDYECKRHVVEKWAEKHPEVPSHKVSTYIDKKQESQYVHDYDNANFGRSKRESTWLEKLRSKEPVEASQLPDNIDRYLFGRNKNSDSGSEVSLPTPSAHYPPTKTDTSQAFPSEASSSSQASSSSSKESKIDFVLAKQACEMPDITDADGGD